MHRNTKPLLDDRDIDMLSRRAYDLYKEVAFTVLTRRFDQLREVAERFEKEALPVIKRVENRIEHPWQRYRYLEGARTVEVSTFADEEDCQFITKITGVAIVGDPEMTNGAFVDDLISAGFNAELRSFNWDLTPPNWIIVVTKNSKELARLEDFIADECGDVDYWKDRSCYEVLGWDVSA